MLTLLVLSAVGVVAAVGLAAITMPDPCSLNTLTASSKCFNCLSATEKLALKDWLMAQALAAMGGTDLTNANDLIDAAKCFACEPKFVLESMDVAVAKYLAEQAGARVDLTISELRAQIKCLVCTDPKTLKAAETILFCKLSALFNPPLL